MLPKTEPFAPLHVALITPGFPSDESDSPCIPALQEYLMGLKKYAPNIRVTVLALRYPHRRTTYHWHGLDVFPSGGRQRPFPVIVPSWVDLMRNFRRLHKASTVHVVHSLWLGECSLLGTVLARRYAIPHVITLMGQDARMKKPYRWLLRLRPNTAVSVSEFQRRDLLARTRDTAHVIPWGIDEAPSGASTRDIDVLGAGSLIEVKHFEKFLRVVHLAKRAKPDLSCTIVGDGPQRSFLGKLASELGLENTVRFDSPVKRERVLELMARSRVLLHTSRFESFGFVFVEALANGARIVSGAVGVAEPGPSWAVEESVPRMAAAVERFLSLGPASPSIPYPLERTARSYAELYQRLSPVAVKEE